MRGFIASLLVCRRHLCSAGIVAGLLAIVLTSSVLLADESPTGPPSDHVTGNDRQFWSFRKILRPTVPRILDGSRIRTPIDQFILAKLDSHGLPFSPDADRRSLMRRVCLDLIGIPPSPHETAVFLADESEDAYEQLVDRLLASPHFGVRWGRHWLDVAGYVDTVGFDVDVDLVILSEQKWLYRDYVIRAFNEDKPYDRFVQEQLAGDELVDWRTAPKFTPQIRELLVATGFLRNAQDLTHEDVGNIPQNHFGTLHDTLEIVGSSLLGLTLNCARCHNHKFDPIPQVDYYRLMAVLAPAYNPDEWKIVIPYDKKLPDRTLADVSLSDRAEIEADNARIEQQIAALAQKLDELRRPYRERLFEQKLANLPEQIRADTQAAIAVPADKRNEVQAYLAAKFSGQLKVNDDEIAAALTPEDKSATAETAAQTAALNRQRRSFGKIQALFDVGNRPVTRLLVRGNFETPGEPVDPGFLRVLCDADLSADLNAVTAPYPGTSGLRLALAAKLTNRDSRSAGLMARVMVNRVWQHLFQSGIVRTPENFGMGGAPPTHPELLEWLSAEFVDSGWNCKSLIRSIVCSTVYRQSADQRRASPAAAPPGKDPAEIDPENRLLARMPLKRLDSEAIRDCVLAICGTMDSTMGGPPIMLEGKPDGMIVVAEKQLPDPTAKWRRSVYLLSRRAFQLSELVVFDQPVVAINCPERARSAVPLQSLAMLNGAFLWDQADRFASHLEQENFSSQHARIVSAFEHSLIRRCSDEELELSVQFLNRQAALYHEQGLDAATVSHKAWMHLCHSLLNTSEFLYAP